MKNTLDHFRKILRSPRLEFSQESLHLRTEFFNKVQVRSTREVTNSMVRLHIIHHEDRIAVQMRQQNILQIMFVLLLLFNGL